MGTVDLVIAITLVATSWWAVTRILNGLLARDQRRADSAPGIGRVRPNRPAKQARPATGPVNSSSATHTRLAAHSR
jgi:hypothetical protein